MQWKRELAGKWMAPVTGDTNAVSRRAIQHFKIGRAAGKTDLARAVSPKGIATQNEKLPPRHTQRIGRKPKIDSDATASPRNRRNGPIEPNSDGADQTK